MYMYARLIWIDGMVPNYLHPGCVGMTKIHLRTFRINLRIWQYVKELPGPSTHSNPPLLPSICFSYLDASAYLRLPGPLQIIAILVSHGSPNSPGWSPACGSGPPGSPRVTPLKRRRSVSPEEATGVNLMVSRCHTSGSTEVFKNSCTA